MNYIKFILQMFEEDLILQGEGSLWDIKTEEYDALLPIPYWTWIDKKSELIELFSRYKDDHKLLFTWSLIKDELENCQVFITGKGIEISPYLPQIEFFGSFCNANQRILMSATTQEDSFFIKGLGFDTESVKNPMTNPHQKWSGKRCC